MRKGLNYAPGQKPYKPELHQFETQIVTHSFERFKISKDIFLNWPETQLGGPTSKWVNQAIKNTRKIHLLVKKIEAPILLFQAGKDEWVKNPRQTKFCQLSRTCRLIHFPNAKHEILMETDDIRDKAISAIKSFLSLTNH